jgi:hypothetical protein
MLQAAFALGVGWPRHAVADPLVFVNVELDAPRDCPDRAALVAELRRDLEGSQAPGTRLRAEVKIERLGPASWRAVVRTESDDGKSERALAARSCAALLDASSLIIAIIIDPETATTNARAIEAVNLPETANQSNAAEPVNPQSPPDATEVANREPAPLATPQEPQKRQLASPHLPDNSGSVMSPTPPTRLRSLTRGSIAAWAAADYGSVPAPTVALGGALGLLYGPWRGEFAAGWWLPRSATWDKGTNPEAGGSFGMLAGSAKVCRRIWELGRMGLGPCAGLEVARWSGTANGNLSNTQSRARWDSSAEAKVLGILAISEIVGLRFDLDVLFPLHRPRFGFTSGGIENRLFQPSAVLLRAGAGVELHFR